MESNVFTIFYTYIYVFEKLVLNPVACRVSFSSFTYQVVLINFLVDIDVDKSCVLQG